MYMMTCWPMQSNVPFLDDVLQQCALGTDRNNGHPVGMLKPRQKNQMVTMYIDTSLHQSTHVVYGYGSLIMTA